MTMPVAAPRANVLLGITFLVTGLWTLTLLDTAGKLLALTGYHVVVIAWARYTLNTVFMALTIAPLYHRRTGKSILTSVQPRLQVIRAIVLLASTLVFFSVLKIVPLAEGTAMNFCAPLIVLAASPLAARRKKPLVALDCSCGGVQRHVDRGSAWRRHRAARRCTGNRIRYHIRRSSHHEPQAQSAR
jgi:hypothetical protein